MPTTFTPIKSASTHCICCDPSHKWAPIPAQQCQEKKEAQQEKQQEIDNAVNEGYSYTIAKANDLAECFDQKPCYFLDIFFQGGTRMVNHHSKVNAHNTFKSLKAQELHKGYFIFLVVHDDVDTHFSLDGHPTRLIRLQDEYKEEYEALTKE